MPYNLLRYRTVVALFTVMILAGLAGGPAHLPARGQAPAGLEPQATPLVAPPQTAPQQTGSQTAPQVAYAVHQDLSPALAELAPQPLIEPASEGHPALSRTLPALDWAEQGVAAPAPDPVIQTGAVAANMPAPQFNFEGIGNRNSVLPPDTNGDIGPNHYMQWVNLSLQIWSLDRETRTATPVYGPVNGSALWSGFGGPCATRNDGDPIVLYDHLADRWLVSQFAIGGPYYQCIAVSQTGDPTGAWYRYAFLISNTKMNDYPHFGVWPDGYYMTANQFSGNSWAGVAAVAFEREKMLRGEAARMIYFDLYYFDSNYFGALPADLDGPPPPPGTPNYFVEVDDPLWYPGWTDALRIWEFKANWATPAASTFGMVGAPNAILDVANFNPLCYNTRNCIPQPGTNQRLDAIADRLMYRVQYRFFGSHSSLVTNHTVNVGSEASPRAAIRWYEARRTGNSWSLQQQGTYAGPAGDSENRWMGSAAMDAQGNLALGYSAASATLYPSIRYTGRLAADPPGFLPQGEGVLMAGNGSQTHEKARWGDYSMLGVDPLDDCTFWYTNQYYAATSLAGWRTRIGSFSFPTCQATQTGSLEGTVTDAASGNPLPNVRVEANVYNTLTDSQGRYRFTTLPAGSYTVTAALYGYNTAQAGNVQIEADLTATQDFVLSLRTQQPVSGVVWDGSGQAWPLYAQVKITAEGFAQTVFTDPRTGGYSLDLLAGVEYELTATAVSPGYLPQTVLFTPGPASLTRDFSLVVDPKACSAPGYTQSGGCVAQTGTLLVGNVFDENTGQAINAADVRLAALPTVSTTSQPTPDDPQTPDGFYTLFSPQTGSAVMVLASKTNYGNASKLLSLNPGSLVAQDFLLPAGRLVAEPTQVDARIDDGLQRKLRLANVGTLPVAFTVSELNGPLLAPQPGSRFAAPTRHTSPKRLNDLDASAVYTYTPPQAPALPGGTVLRAWQSGLARPWGIGLDTQRGVLWVGSVLSEGGDDRLHPFLPGGAGVGGSIDLSGRGPAFSADLAYNPLTGMFWQADVGGGSCLVEVDPLERALTGASLCPPFGNAQRGLAYDPLSDSFYSGAWTDGILYHFTAGGALLESLDTGLNIAGLAFNPATRHLFVLSNASQGFDLYVLDTADGYRVLGGFSIPGLGAFEQAGLELDCAGHLWAVNQVSGMVFEVESGERGACAWSDIPWLEVSPLSGSVPPGGVQELTLSFNSNAQQAGINAGRVVVNDDSPYSPLEIPVTLTTFQVFLPFVQ